MKTEFTIDRSHPGGRTMKKVELHEIGSKHELVAVGRSGGRQNIHEAIHNMVSWEDGKHNKISALTRMVGVIAQRLLSEPTSQNIETLNAILTPALRAETIRVPAKKFMNPDDNYRPDAKRAEAEMEDAVHAYIKSRPWIRGVECAMLQGHSGRVAPVVVSYCCDETEDEFCDRMMNEMSYDGFIALFPDAKISATCRDRWRVRDLCGTGGNR